MNKEIRKFINSINENPNYLNTRKVIAMVDGEVVAGDDYSTWLGQIRKITVDAMYKNDERIYLNSNQYDIEELEQDYQEYIYHDLISKGVNDGEIACNYDIEKMAQETVDQLKWEEVIIFHIGV